MSARLVALACTVTAVLAREKSSPSAFAIRVTGGVLDRPGVVVSSVMIFVTVRRLGAHRRGACGGVSRLSV